MKCFALQLGLINSIIFQSPLCKKSYLPINKNKQIFYLFMISGILNKTSVDIPNGIYSIGHKLNIIEDVLQGDNDNKTKWIASKPWIFTSTFTGTFFQLYVYIDQKIMYNFGI